MSYCRWSSNNFECDIYSFASVYGTYEVWVAARRHVSDKPKPKVPPLPVHGSEEEIDEWMKQNNLLNDWMEKAETVDIGLPCDGAQYSFTEPGDAAKKMEELKAIGYVVPQYAINALKEEQEELKEKENG